MSRLLQVLAAIGVLALLGHGAARGIRTYLSNEYSDASCTPCPDLNSCQPLELTLELSKPWPRTNRTYTLWHRVQLKNVSCLNIPGFRPADISMSGLESGTYGRQARNGLYYKVWNERGQEVAPYTVLKPTPSTYRSPGNLANDLREWEASGLEDAIPTTREVNSEFGRVIPYQLGPDPLDDPSRRLDADKDGFTTLRPGDWIRSLRSTLAPFVPKSTLIDVRDAHGIWTYSRDEQIPAAPPPGAQKPPPGFQVLRGYLFKKPGKYRIAACYTRHPPFSAVERIFPRYEALSPGARRILAVLAKLGIDLQPQARIKLPLDVQSNVVEFEVLP